MLENSIQNSKWCAPGAAVQSHKGPNIFRPQGPKAKKEKYIDKDIHKKGHIEYILFYIEYIRDIYSLKWYCAFFIHLNGNKSASSINLKELVVIAEVDLNIYEKKKNSLVPAWNIGYPELTVWKG